MSSVSLLTVKVNNIDTTVEVKDIPAVSTTSLEIFKEHCKNTSIEVISKLEVKASTLINTIQQLQEAKSTSVKDKILCILRTILTVGIVVGGVLGCLTLAWCPPAAIGVGIATFLAYTGLCYYNTNRTAPNLVKSNFITPFIIWAIGAFIPLYEGFGKIGRLENSLKEQKNEMEIDIKNVISFFDKHCEALERALEKEVVDYNKTLEALKNLPKLTLQGEAEIHEKLERYNKALEDFKNTKSFYNQLQTLVNETSVSIENL